MIEYPYAPAPGQTDTSAAAADFLAPKIGRLQRTTLQIIKEAGARGITTKEIAELCGIDRGSVQPRTSELKLLGLIHDSGYRRCNANGKKAIVWVAKEVTNG
ncbi:MAG: hypothetical protein AB7G25_09160 [Sphingomonadaceae bacterium]